MRATLEHAESKGETDIPPITVRVFKTKNDITIKISDVGGGISRASSGKIFNYMYSTAPQVWLFPTRGRLAPQLLSCLGRHSWRWRLAGCWPLRRVVTNARPRLRPASVQTICKVNIVLIISCITTLSVKVLSWRHSDRVRGRLRDRRVRLPAEVESPRPGEPPGLQRRVQRQAP